MKRLLIIATLFLMVVAPAAAQEPEPYRLYLPLVESGMPSCERTWRIIKPDGTDNEVLNPSGETTGNYAGAAATRVTTYSHYGLYSYRLQTAAAGQGVALTTAALANATHYVTLRVRGHLPPAWALTVGVTTRSPRLIEAIDADWSLYGALFTAAECNGRTSVSVTQAGAGAGDFYIDGMQVEANNYWTTYVDGTQEGCAWDGAAHASTSTRSAQSRAGGLVRDLYDTYGFLVEQVIGAGAAPVLLNVRGYAILPGGELSGAKAESRQFTLVGRFVADSEHDLHQKRQDLIKELSIDTYPEKQALRLRFTGATVQKQISAFYVGGLEADLKVSYGPWQVEGDDQWRKVNYWTEKVAVQFLAPDPMWYEVGESAVVLDTNDSATVRIVAGRLKDTGQWDPLGPPAAPGTAVYTSINAIAEDGTYVYYGGDFVNFNNNGSADYIVRYNKQTGAWSPLGVGTDGIVRALAIAPDGRLVVGGDFANAGGGAVNYIAIWDPVAGTWAAIGPGPGLDARVYALTFGLDGSLYAGGNFTDIFGGPTGTYNYIIRWTGAAWAALGTGMNAVVYGLATGLRGEIYAAGAFTTAGGGGANRVARWENLGWFALSTGVDVPAYAIAVAADNSVFFGGDFVIAGGITVNRVTKWDGNAFVPLGVGATGQVWKLRIGPNGDLFASGTFAQIGGIDVADRMGRYNGSSWSHLDADMPGGPQVYGLLVGQADPVVESNYDIFIGFSTTGTAYFAGLVTATNDGTQPAYPKIVFERAGGTSAIIETVRNEDTGKILLLNYSLLDGERLTINLEPTEKSIVSSMFGPRLDAILPNSDFGTWALQPGGNNNVSSFVNTDATVTAYMLWKDSFKSLD